MCMHIFDASVSLNQLWVQFALGPSCSLGFNLSLARVVIGGQGIISCKHAFMTLIYTYIIYICFHFFVTPSGRPSCQRSLPRRSFSWNSCIHRCVPNDLF